MTDTSPIVTAVKAETASLVADAEAKAASLWTRIKLYAVSFAAGAAAGAVAVHYV